MWRSAVQPCQGLLGAGCAGSGGNAETSRRKRRGISSDGLEHLPCKQGVKGSSPLFSTEKKGIIDMVATRRLRKEAEEESRETERRKPKGKNQGRPADALASGGEEGRDRLRKAPGRREWPLIRGCPNGGTHAARAAYRRRSGGANAGNRNIPVPAGKENNSDSASSGERKRSSPNRGRRGATRGSRGAGEADGGSDRNRMERRAAGGESPVREAGAAARRYLSRAGHEESRPNQPGPSGKAKYHPKTDSGQVP